MQNALLVCCVIKENDRSPVHTIEPLMHRNLLVRVRLNHALSNHAWEWLYRPVVTTHDFEERSHSLRNIDFNQPPDGVDAY